VNSNGAASRPLSGSRCLQTHTDLCGAGPTKAGVGTKDRHLGEHRIDPGGRGHPWCEFLDFARPPVGKRITCTTPVRQ
jgi:hypothetical protein